MFSSKLGRGVFRFSRYISSADRQTNGVFASTTRFESCVVRALPGYSPPSSHSCHWPFCAVEHVQLVTLRRGFDCKVVSHDSQCTL